MYYFKFEFHFSLLDYGIIQDLLIGIVVGRFRFAFLSASSSTGENIHDDQRFLGLAVH